MTSDPAIVAAAERVFPAPNTPLITCMWCMRLPLIVTCLTSFELTALACAGGAVQTIEVTVAGITDVGDRLLAMDPNDLFWDEDLTSDLEWSFVSPVPKASSMSPVRPRAPPQPFVTVQDLQHWRPIPEFDRSIPDSLITTRRSDPLPVPTCVSSIPSTYSKIRCLTTHPKGNFQ